MRRMFVSCPFISYDERAARILQRQAQSARLLVGRAAGFRHGRRRCGREGRRRGWLRRGRFGAGADDLVAVRRGAAAGRQHEAALVVVLHLLDGAQAAPRGRRRDGGHGIAQRRAGPGREVGRGFLVALDVDAQFGDPPAFGADRRSIRRCKSGCRRANAACSAWATPAAAVGPGPSGSDVCR